MRSLRHDNRGMVLFFIVLIFASAGILALSVLARSGLYTFLDAGQQLSTWNTRADVYGCADEFLIQLVVDEDYAPAQIDTLDAQCNLTVTTPVVGERQATISWTENEVTRSMVIDITLSPFEVTGVEEVL